MRRLFTGWCIVLLTAPFWSLLLDAYAQESVSVGDREQGGTRFEMDEVVVSATKIQDTVKEIARNVTVITAEDIEQAPSNNVVDLLAREADVNIRSFYGHDKQAGVDVRGMGDTLVSNVLVMVDGFRLNSPDLSGADLSTIPLDQIERIEIVRGAGSVLYGDGAVGGVINIITKKGFKGKPEFNGYGSYGSYDTYDTRASLRGGYRDLSYNINADYYDTNGYRDNGYYKKKDGAARLGYDLGSHVTLSLSGSWHDDDYGLPGSVSKEDEDSRSRRTGTDNPDDEGQTTDRIVSGGTEIDLGGWGAVKMVGFYRQRNNEFILGYTPLLSRSEQTNDIDEDSWNLDLGFVKEYQAWGQDHRFQCGFEYYQTDYKREEPTRNQRKNSYLKRRGLFFLNKLTLLSPLTFQMGYRYSNYYGRFRTDKRRREGSERLWERGSPFTEDWNNHAYDLGLVYSLSPDTSFFASYSTSFRTPNADEFAQALDGLDPQKGKHFDLGARHRIGAIAELSATLFWMEVKDEIFFGIDPDTGFGVNRNYEDKTHRRGVEIEAKFYPTDYLFLWGNYTYMKAEFEGRNTWVPLVPEHKGSVGMEWEFLDSLILSMTGTYVGSRYDGNDEFNDRFRKLSSYTVIDAKITYRYRDMSVFGGVNNIKDELYSTVSYSETYYPMPTRNYYAGVAFHF